MRHADMGNAVSQEWSIGWVVHETKKQKAALVVPRCSQVGTEYGSRISCCLAEKQRGSTPGRWNASKRRGLWLSRQLDGCVVPCSSRCAGGKEGGSELVGSAEALGKREKRGSPTPEWFVGKPTRPNQKRQGHPRQTSERQVCFACAGGWPLLGPEDSNPNLSAKRRRVVRIEPKSEAALGFLSIVFCTRTLVRGKKRQNVVQGLEQRRERARWGDAPASGLQSNESGPGVSERRAWPSPGFVRAWLGRPPRKWEPRNENKNLHHAISLSLASLSWRTLPLFGMNLVSRCRHLGFRDVEMRTVSQC